TSPTVITPAGRAFDGSSSAGNSGAAESCALSLHDALPIYAWTPSFTGTATIETCGGTTNFDSVLYVREADCSTGTELACNDDSCGAQSRVNVSVTSGTTYYIFVDGLAGSSGDFTLTVTPIT